MPFFDIFASPRWWPLRMRTKVASFFIFFQDLSNKKKIKALRPKMTKIASRGGPALNRLVFSFFHWFVGSLQRALKLLTAAGIQARHCYRVDLPQNQHIPVCSDPGKRSTGPRIDMSTCISKLPEDRHHAVKPVIAKLESLGVGSAFSVVQCIRITCIHMNVVRHN